MADWRQTAYIITGHESLDDGDSRPVVTTLRYKYQYRQWPVCGSCGRGLVPISGADWMKYCPGETVVIGCGCGTRDWAKVVRLDTYGMRKLWKLVNRQLGTGVFRRTVKLLEGG